jgi:hypothetical protein
VINKNSIIAACRLRQMKPLCDHSHYADAQCDALGGGWHFSHPSHDRQHGVDVNKVKYAFFYTGRHGHGALLNTGSTHRWVHNSDRDGDTYCVGDGSWVGAERIHVGDTVALWNKVHKKFACMPNSGGRYMTNGCESNKRNEEFTVQKGDGFGTISLYGEHRKAYMQMDSKQSKYMSTSRDKGRRYGTVFQVVPGKDKSIALWSPRADNRRFVRVNGGEFMDFSGVRNNANLPDNWSWERFQVHVRKKAPKAKCQGQVSLYQHGKFNGWHARFPKGSYANLRQRGAKDNEVSSIKVPKGCVATLYYNEGYGGGTGTFTAGDYPAQRFRQFFKDNRASSMKVTDST